ncbi:DUF779 domain-containing protein [Nocardia sp. NBC_01503]|uniref:DUF779 domain-containing protein n=1 Tax=Nocardia sp. NBC_01503 TaxID=2975997 RepID=UPI002E7BD751|nr:DUF779 domain-containing protein [Nocardia sp. NBC_01503]WTL29094.1 DUF779 domain-containing protein [Nocardia sp. NBC_01503]
MPAPGPRRVRATAAAMDLLRRLRVTHGPLMLHQSGGCCDGSAPMCYPAGEFVIGDRDVLLGLLDLRLSTGEQAITEPPSEDVAAVWISGPQFSAWQHTQLVLDVVPGRGSGFSLEAPEGYRFLSRGRVFEPAELDALNTAELITGETFERGARPVPSPEPQVVAEAVDACPVPGR